MSALHYILQWPRAKVPRAAGGLRALYVGRNHNETMSTEHTIPTTAQVIARNRVAVDLRGMVMSYEEFLALLMLTRQRWPYGGKTRVVVYTAPAHGGKVVLHLQPE